ncbi:hypothetical protein OG473_01855 [Streptomyces anulatus]|uniref:hypothetical protein n=1 Tax=Streptomyces anulatus TaxID=1892 RepID=UPI00324910F2
MGASTTGERSATRLGSAGFRSNRKSSALTLPDNAPERAGDRFGPGLAGLKPVEGSLDQCLESKQVCLIPVILKSDYSEPTLQKALLRTADDRLVFQIDAGSRS